MARIISSEWGKGDRGFACRAAARIAAEQAKEVEGLVEAARNAVAADAITDQVKYDRAMPIVCAALRAALSAFPPPTTDKEPHP